MLNISHLFFCACGVIEGIVKLKSLKLDSKQSWKFYLETIQSQATCY